MPQQIASTYLPCVLNAPCCSVHFAQRSRSSPMLTSESGTSSQLPPLLGLKNLPHLSHLGISIFALFFRLTVAITSNFSINRTALTGFRLSQALGRRVMGTFISSAYTLRTVQQVSALVPLTGGWMPQPRHPISSAALRGASYSMPMFLRPFSDQPRSNPAVQRTPFRRR